MGRGAHPRRGIAPSPCARSLRRTAGAEERNASRSRVTVGGHPRAIPTGTKVTIRFLAEDPFALPGIVARSSDPAGGAHRIGITFQSLPLAEEKRLLLLILIQRPGPTSRTSPPIPSPRPLSGSSLRPRHRRRQPQSQLNRQAARTRTDSIKRFPAPDTRRTPPPPPHRQAGVSRAVSVARRGREPRVSWTIAYLRPPSASLHWRPRRRPNSAGERGRRTIASARSDRGLVES